MQKCKQNRIHLSSHSGPGQCSRSADSSAPFLIQETVVTIHGLQGRSANNASSPSERGQAKVQGQRYLQGKWSKDDTCLSLFHSSGKSLNTGPHLATRGSGTSSPRLEPDRASWPRRRGENGFEWRDNSLCYMPNTHCMVLHSLQSFLLTACSPQFSILLRWKLCPREIKYDYMRSHS